MPSLQHEAIVELFRNRPVLAAELLAEVFSAPLPQFTETRIEAADLADVVPRELRADLLVLLLDARPVLVIVVEVQLSDDPDKQFIWPAYVVGARARYRCPACLLVVTPHVALATRLAKPIELGPGGDRITPFVLGPEGIPAVTDLEAARQRPELAVLSAVAHKKDVGVAVAALAASVGIKDAERMRLYSDLVLLSLDAAVRKALEENMDLANYKVQSEFLRKYIEIGKKEGFDQGREDGALESLSHQFGRRLGRPLTSEERSTLMARIHDRGIDRVSDVVLDLSPPDLAAWLAEKNGA